MRTNRIISKKSVFFEKLIEHRFIADIMMLGWFHHNKEVRILHCEIDNTGFDILINCGGIDRYIQLKTSDYSSKRSYQKFNTTLLQKQNPCIIWITYYFNPEKRDLDLRYLFWGKEIGQRTPGITQFGIGKTKTNSQGIKKELAHIRNIPRGHFHEVPPGKLFEKLFGPQIEAA